MSLLSSCSESETTVAQSDEKLVIYCGAGLKTIMEQVGEMYTEDTGVEIEFIYNGSGALMSQAILAQTGDLFIPGEKSYLDKMKEEEGDDVILVQEELFENVPVILVAKEKEMAIQSLEDLTKPTSNIGLGEDSIAIGKLFNVVLENKGIKEAVDQQVSVRFGTVNQVVTAVEMGQIDAGVAFYLNYVDCNQEKIGMVKISEEDNVTQNVAIGVLKYTENETLAREFLEFVTLEGQSVFEKYAYTY
jgi:molybdate transport system substrate-binding protein